MTTRTRTYTTAAAARTTTTTARPTQLQICWRGDATDESDDNDGDGGGGAGRIVPNCAFNFGHFHLRATRLISLASCTTLGLTICYHFCLRSSRSPFSYSFISFSFISFLFFGADSIIWRCYRGCRMDHRYLRTCVCMCVRAVFVLLLLYVDSVCV